MHEKKADPARSTVPVADTSPRDTADISSSSWRVIGRCVTGASHQRTGKPNQDALGWLPASGFGLPLALAVADGHGSAKSFRSEQGADYAVQVATTTLLDFLACHCADFPLSMTREELETRQPRELVLRWNARVDADLEDHPLTAEELGQLREKEGERACAALARNPRMAYGTTLLAVLVTDAYLAYLQLGDGEILTVSDLGDVTLPLPRDERLFANETTSLCLKEAWKDFRFGFQTLAGAPPALVLLTTDGYVNSFRDQAGFLRVGTDLLEMLRTDGVTPVEEGLTGWLTEASQLGSGDDITLGLVIRMPALETYPVHPESIR